MANPPRELQGQPVDELTRMSDANRLESLVEARSYAEISKAVYDPEIMETENWKRVGQDQLDEIGLGKAVFEDPKSGLRAGLYQHKQTGEFALSYSGTRKGLNQWKQNFQQGLGMDSKEYEKAAELARDVSDQSHNIGPVSVTGHSKGGGLATQAAAIMDTRAHIFNSAGVHSKTLAEHGISKAGFDAKVAQTGQIEHYVVQGEALNMVNSVRGVPNPSGIKEMLPKAPGRAGAGRRHQMDYVMDRLDKEIGVTYSKQQAHSPTKAEAWMPAMSEIEMAQMGDNLPPALREKLGISIPGLTAGSKGGVHNLADKVSVEGRDGPTAEYIGKDMSPYARKARAIHDAAEKRFGSYEAFLSPKPLGRPDDKARLSLLERDGETLRKVGVIASVPKIARAAHRAPAPQIKQPAGPMR